jgi:hypothetical protein
MVLSIMVLKLLFEEALNRGGALFEEIKILKKI